MNYVRPRTAQAQLSIYIALAERGKNHYVLASDEAYMDTMIEVQPSIMMSTTDKSRLRLRNHS